MQARRNTQSWTDTDDAELIVLERDRTPRRDSAEQLGRTQASVETRITRLKATERV